MNRTNTAVLLALAQGYAWFIPYMVFQHIEFGTEITGQDMGLMTMVPAIAWALLVSTAASFIFYYKTQRFPWDNIALIVLFAVPAGIASLYSGVSTEVLGIFYRFGLIPAGRKSWESFDTATMSIILIVGFFTFRRGLTAKKS